MLQTTPLQDVSDQIASLVLDKPLELATMSREEASGLREALGEIPGAGRLLPEDQVDAAAAVAALLDRGLLVDEGEGLKLAPALAPALFFLTAPTSVLLVDPAGDDGRRDTWYGLADTVYLLQRESAGSVALTLMRSADAVDELARTVDPSGAASTTGALEGWPIEQNGPLDTMRSEARAAWRVRASRIENDEVVDVTYGVVVGSGRVWVMSGGDIPGVGERSTSMEVDRAALRATIERLMCGSQVPLS